MYFDIIVLLSQGKQGEIKHVYRGSVFIQSRNMVENGGLIVSKARHVELAGGAGIVSVSVYVYVSRALFNVTYIHTSVCMLYVQCGTLAHFL